MIFQKSTSKHTLKTSHPPPLHPYKMNPPKWSHHHFHTQHPTSQFTDIMCKKGFSNLFLLCLSFLLSFHLLPSTTCCHVINGMFVFGSSLVDNGNNNYLQNSIAKADFLPYGVDFPGGPSGRFNNGKNVIDLLGDHLKLPFIPVFADPATKGDRIVHGVNFASGGSGILDDTGSAAVNVTTLNQQMENFEGVTLPELEAQLGCKSSESLPNYLFVFGTGGNDYSFNYFLHRNSTVKLQDFTANLIASLSLQLKKLYQIGGRKFVLMSVNPLGCVPSAKTNGTTCVEVLNTAAQLFNDRLKSLVIDIKSEMPGSDLVLVNAYNIIMDIINDPVGRGFGDATNPCCEVGLILCKSGGHLCADRSKNVFYDGLHPAEAVNVVIADKAFSSNLQTEVFPFNVQQLTQ